MRDQTQIQLIGSCAVCCSPSLLLNSDLIADKQAIIIPMDDPGSTVQASMFFLTPDELHKQQRPYTFKFPPYNGCPQSNMTHEKINGITVENMRGREDQFQLERNGFTILKVNTGLEYDDFFKQKGVIQYLRLMEGVLKARLGASRVDVFRYGV